MVHGRRRRHRRRALTDNPELHVIAVVPRYPDSDGPLAGPPSRIGQIRAIACCGARRRTASASSTWRTRPGTPIYVHAKICIVDDTWMTCGSDNFNRRSWTTDSELTCAVLDTSPPSRRESGPRSGGLAGDLRRQLWAEHLGTEPGPTRACAT